MTATNKGTTKYGIYIILKKNTPTTIHTGSKRKYM